MAKKPNFDAAPGEPWEEAERDDSTAAADEDDSADASAEMEPGEVEATDEELEQQLDGSRPAAAKVRKFPQSPGVYLMKDASGQVIYVGKAKNLRSRAGSYFLKAAEADSRTAAWVGEIEDIDYLSCESEVDALLVESRLIKDIQPRHNREQKDGKSFPYLQIITNEDFPRVEITRTPRTSGVKLYGPFPSVGNLRGAIQVLQRIFKFRTCSLDIDDGDPRWRWFRPCLLASIRQCTAPCNLRISKEDYRRDIKKLMMFMEGKKERLLKSMEREMADLAKSLQFEQAGKLRDEIQALRSLDSRGDIDVHAQPEVFYIDPKRGLAGLKKVLRLDRIPRTIEGVDIAHLAGKQTVASLVQFIDGLPFKPGYRRYKIQGVQGVDDFRSIHEVVARRFKRKQDEGDVFPDMLLIDGGKGQLGAALAAFEALEIEPPVLLSLAKKNEEIYLPGQSEPIILSRHSFGLRLLQYIRDEAHRFAQHYHHMLRDKSQRDDLG